MIRMADNGENAVYLPMMIKGESAAGSCRTDDQTSHHDASDATGQTRRNRFLCECIQPEISLSLSLAMWCCDATAGLETHIFAPVALVRAKVPPKTSRLTA